MFKKLALIFALIISTFIPIQAHANNDFIGGLIAGGIVGAIISNGQNQNNYHYRQQPMYFYDDGYNYQYRPPVCRNRIVNRFNNYYGVWERVVVRQCYDDSF